MPQTHDSIEFCIPDQWEDWLERSGLAGGSLVNDHFESKGAEKLLEIQQIRSPVRSSGVTWFHENNMLPILRGIAQAESIPPIDVDKPPEGLPPYRVRDGFHRYYASVLLGFRRIPVRVIDYLARRRD